MKSGRKIWIGGSAGYSGDLEQMKLLLLRPWWWENFKKLTIEKQNMNNGAIALGHQVGASGARILVTLLCEMKKREVDLGLATLCVGGGMGVSTVLQRMENYKSTGGLHGIFKF